MYSYAGMMCARFDNNGNIIPHSILGDVDEFKEEALRRGDLPVVSCDSFSLPTVFMLCFAFKLFTIS